MLYKRGLPIGTLLLILVLALATVGVGYGLWSKTLYIDGTVYTGVLDAGLSIKEVDQSYSFNDGLIGNGIWDDDEWEGKDIGECYAELIDPWTMEVTVTNGYPFFNCFVLYDVHNPGTIPFDLYGPDYFYGGVFVGTGGLYTIDTPELHVNTFPPPCFEDGMQVDPGDEVLCSLHIALYQQAEMNATYTFQVKFFARQWNEEVVPPWR
jgi:hypothetical protein